MTAGRQVNRLEGIGNSKKGFTLIELMVTIAIIAILSAVGAVTYSTAQKQGRISKRIQDLNAIRTNLEVYKTATGNYPTSDPIGTVSAWRSECSGWLSKANNDVIPSATGFVPNYMPVFPTDPATDKVNHNCYLYRTDGNDYKIMAYLLFDMTNAEIFSKPEMVDPRYNGNPAYYPSGFSMTFCTGASGNGDNRAWSLYSDGGRCF